MIPHCVRCGAAIGTYEPAHFVLADDSQLSPSPLSLHAEREQSGSVALHEHCYSASLAEQPDPE
jgi:hypothetical protein